METKQSGNNHYVNITNIQIQQKENNKCMKMTGGGPYSRNMQLNKYVMAAP
jgi:hypothetical protein